MISIIVCHRNKDLLDQLAINILETTGTENELIVIDNTSNQYNIFQAYNEGVRRSKFPILCFAHEDLKFHTADWGKKVAQHFQDPSIGILGTIGGTAFPACPAPWWSNRILNQPHLNVIQHCHDQKPAKDWIRQIVDADKNIIHEYYNPTGENVAEVVALDGFFFCIRKELFDKIRFDDVTFNGFHCYDTDICFQAITLGFKAVVVYDVLIEHFSMGTINTTWANSVEKLADKWKQRLPLFAGNIDSSKISPFNNKALLTYCYWVQGLSWPDKRIRKTIKKYLRPSEQPYKESLLLRLWMQLGYRMAGIPYKFLKVFYK